MIIDLCESQSSQPQLEDEIDDGVTIVKSSSTSKVMDKVTVVFDAADDEDFDNVVIVRSSSPLETRGTIDQGKTALYSSSSSSRQAIQILSAPASSSLSSSSTSSRDNVIVLAESISSDPLSDVIKVFPDADPMYCQTLLTQNGDDSGVVLR